MKPSKALLAAALYTPLAALTPATAQQSVPYVSVPWGVSDKPSGNAGSRFCMIWAGRTQPMFNFAVYEHDSRRIPKLVISAPWLRGQADLSPVDVQVVFPDGSRWETRGVYGVQGNATVTAMPAIDELAELLSRPSYNPSGPKDITITIGGTTKRFLVPEDMSTVLPAMRSCVAALNPVRAQ